MSQRTRARTTGGATNRRNKSAPKAEPVLAPLASSREQPDATAVASSSTSTAGTGDAPPPEQPTTAAASPFAPETLARTLRAVAAELERDPDLARRVARAAAEPPRDVAATLPAAQATDGVADTPEQAMEAPAKGKRTARTFRPRLVTGLSPELGQGVIDPFAILATRGEDGLRATLDELRLGSLRAIIREHQIDPSGKLAQQNDAEKLRGAILAAARKRRT